MTDTAESNQPKDRPFRRTVFFISGFHDFGFRFFWPILKRNARRHERLYGRAINVTEKENGATLKLDDFGHPVEVDYQYLPWNDIAGKRIRQPLWQIYWHMIARILFYHLNGRYFRLMKAYWGFTNGVYYMLGTLLLSSFLVFWATSALTGSTLLSLVLAYFLPSFFFERFEKYFRLKLMWLIFRMSLDQAGGRAPDLEARLEDFEQHLSKALEDHTADEIVIVGHSYGSILGVMLAGRLHEKGLIGKNTPAFSLLTLGDINALHAIANDDNRFKAALVGCSSSPDISWLCCFCPQDGLNFPRYNVAKRVYGLKDAIGPHFKSMRVRELLTPQNYKALRKSFWDMHFQYLKEGNYQGAYSYFRLIGAARGILQNYGITQQEEDYARAKGIEKVE